MATPQRSDLSPELLAVLDELAQKTVPSLAASLKGIFLNDIRNAEQAAEARGAERMRERCWQKVQTMGNHWRGIPASYYDYSGEISAADDIATALAALPLEEGKE